MIGDPAFARTHSRGGRLARLDPRFLILTFLVLILFTFAVPRSAGLLILVAYVAVLAIIAGTPPLAIVRRLRPMVFFFLFALILNAILVAGRPLPGLLSFLSVEGFVAGVYMGLRIIVIYLAAFVFLEVLSQEAAARGVAALVRPFSPRLSRRLALYGFLSLGFVPLFADEFDRIRTVQRFRGGTLDGGVKTRLASVRLLLVPLLISAIHRSGQLALAVEVRGIKRTIANVLAIPPPQSRDYVFAALSAATFLVATLA